MLPATAPSSSLNACGGGGAQSRNNHLQSNADADALIELVLDGIPTLNPTGMGDDRGEKSSSRIYSKIVSSEYILENSLENILGIYSKNILRIYSKNIFKTIPKTM